ncbi:LOW QUALITY PROTEIN: intracellular hyaluronan-binding protein 4 [Phasianus colchicus]|uniref:LOW QUALITY PROTEIN: intracellular hyaluronan-binding protein 4 n=1 Tax=Phasianus colchicus TaxID=9054 RepID=UPI00129E709B|nr:LOW QUALITY PROTEIN: intracellular hyaluronan-binding protein 4 [Phasianus colchicus]
MATAMMKGAMGCPVADIMEVSFSCAVANRFYQLLDDESGPFDNLREAERRQQQRKSLGKAVARRGCPGGRGGTAKREPQKQRKQLGAPAPPPQLGQKQVPKQEDCRGKDSSRAEKQDKTEWRPSFTEYSSCETESQAELTAKRPIEKLDCERPTGCGRGKDEMQGRGRGCGTKKKFDGFDYRGKREFKRQSDDDEIVAEGKPMEEVVQEMTLDEWKNLQQQNRPKHEFNIRRPEPTVPSKAVVIHKSKYSDDRQKGELEDDYHIFRRVVNDITSQLDINFGSLFRPGYGSRGARGCDRGRRVEETGPQPEVMVQIFAPNPDDPEDFPALT